MNTNILSILKKYIPAGIVAILLMGCERELDDLQPATFPSNPEVFIDGFSAGLSYSAFGGSVPTAFDVDQDVTFDNSKSSMRFDVPNAGDPQGAYAGGVFSTEVSRDLSDYNALSFWAKASQSAVLDLVGFGNDLGASKYQVTISDLAVSTSWKKYIIPIPDPSRLTEERGMFFYSVGPEDGKGFSFWIDELKFENLGTIAHPQPMILDGNDKVESAVNGLKFPVGGLGMSFNMPSGIDQKVNAAPAWFTFLSSDAAVASVDAAGLVTVVSEGTAVITATSGDDDAKGSLTVQSSGDFTHAPEPAAAQEDVISIFSNHYVNVPVDFYNGYWEPFQTTTSADFIVNDDDVLFYNNFNFVGIQFTSPTIDATNMTHLHMDIWIPNEVDPADKLAIRLVDMGPDGALDGTDPSLTYELAGPLDAQSWISVDIDLSGLTSRSKLAQIILEQVGSSLTGLYLDNVYLYGNGGGTVTEPAEAAPTPPERDAANVISIYGDEYDNLEGTDYPDWGQATVVSDVQIAGNNTLKFAGLNYQGIQLASSQNLTGMEYLHLDFWTASSAGLSVFLISNGPVEKGYALTVPTTGWASVDIPLSDFSPVDLANVIQMKFDGNGDIYLDNIYFHTSSGGSTDGPTVAAPAPPSRDAADVISLFSNAYTNNGVDTWSADWDDSDVADVQVAGDDVKKYSFTNFAGIDFSSNKFDASGMTHFHMDIWTPDDVMSKSLSIKNVDFGGGTAEASNHILTVVHTSSGDIPALETGSWVSIDVPISAFTGDQTRSDLAQMVLTSNLGTVYVDNIYFYTSGGSTATEPTSAAPTPPARDAGDVISLFSNAYTNETVGTWSAEWDDSDVADFQVADDDVKKYTFTNFAGIDFSSNKLDASEMTHFHLDIWTPNEVLSKSLTIKNVDFGGGNAEASSYILTVEHTPKGEIPALATGSWVSIDVPISAFSGDLTRTDLAQLVLSCNLTTVYIDNLYFYKSGGSGATEPTEAAATPTEDAGGVISVFSDAYTDIANTNFDPDWGQSTDATIVAIGGNDVLKYANLNYQGTNIGGADGVEQDISAKGYVHLDYWTANATALKIFLISTGPAEKPYPLTVPTNGSWASVDIPLSEFSSVVDLTKVFQLKVEGDGDVYLDNIYFYGEPGSGGGGGDETGPTAAAPTPPARDAGNVVSIYSDAYTNIGVDNFDAGWCGGAATTQVAIAGNNTLKKNAGIDCHGIDFSSNRQDLSTFTHIHFDFYTDDTDLTGDVFNIKLVDFAGGTGEASALEVNINTGTTPTIVAGSWVSVDIDITSLGGIVTGNLTRSDVAQIGITTANLTNVWYDNVYLYK
tara:strand:+ start:4177 stop:8151 length:3975 start_codon:yes stop_codon:yes gene_type:complete